jgi:outer membrane cobalamin receptor
MRRLEVGMNAIYKTKRFTNAANTDILKHYALFNLSSSFKVNDTAQVLFEIKNVFDRVYQEQREYPLAGRSFYGGIKLEF